MYNIAVDGDYLNSDDEMENYINEVQEWAMSHGASNEEGRMSKHFFKPGNSFLENSSGLNWTYALEMEKLGFINFESDRIISFNNENADSPRNIAVSRVIRIRPNDAKKHIKFHADIENLESSLGEYLIQLIIKISTPDGEQFFRKDVKSSISNSNNAILSFDDEVETGGKMAGEISLSLYIKKDSRCKLRADISCLEMDGNDYLANPSPPFELLDGAFENFNWLRDKKISIISGCELSYVSRILKRAGMDVSHTYENHGAMDPYTELMNPNPSVNVGSSDYIVLSQVQIIRSLITFWERNRGSTSPNHQKKQLESTIQALDWSINKIREVSDSPIWLTTHIWTDNPIFGIHEYRGCGDGMSVNELVLYYKLLLYGLCKKHDSTYVLDVDLALDSHGKWPVGSGPRIRPYESLGGHPEENGAKIIVGHLYHQFCTISKHITKIKCAILDCDNTLWDGVLREDGVDGIKVHKNRLAKLRHLSRRGLILALCSKNDPEDEELILRVLRDNDSEMADAIVSTRINWQPKSANISSIVDELNIGKDSVVFFDDNPFERAEVNSVTPEIRVFDAIFIEESTNWPIFHPYGDITSDTGNRFQLYKDESKRKEVEEGFEENDFESFLHSCGLRLEIRSAMSDDLPRVSELIQRTNQMNATLKRFDLLEIRKKFTSDTDHIFITKLGDNFGDYGIIGTAICSIEESQISIDELALSCRAMGRKVEHALLEEVVGFCQDNDLMKIGINVQKTSRNHQIISILEECGFEDSDSEGQIHLYELDVSGRKGREFPPWFTLGKVGSSDGD